MFKFSLFSIVALFVSGLSASVAQQIQVPMSPESFSTDIAGATSSVKTAQFGEFLGRHAVYLPSGLLALKGANFRDGTMEADVASKPGGLFLGMVFRVESAANMEVIYLRPGAS